MKTAYSYIRFSSAAQADGDSLRRQLERTEDYCRRNKLTLSTESFRDLGVSAWKSKNSLAGNLSLFLEAIQSGRVPKGSVLIVESIDRISRAGIDAGYEVIKKILKSGVNITTLSPERTFDAEAVRSLSKGALEIQLILERAAEESDRKSERVSYAWQQKQKLAAAGQKTPAHLPAWLRWDGKNIQLIPEKVKTVQRIFSLAVQGHGAGAITRQLNADGTTPLTGRKHWSRSSVHKLLSSESVLGVYVPHRLRDGKRQQSGEVLKDYYPRVVDEDAFLSAQAAIRSRKGIGGPAVNGVGVNVFAGLLFDARDGAKMRILGKHKVIASSLAVETKKGYVSFPLAAFEAAVFSLLTEIDVQALLTDQTGEQGDDIQVLKGRLAKAEKELEAVRRSLDTHGFDDDLDARLRRLKKDRTDLTEQIKTKESADRHTVTEAWAEAKSIVQAMQDATDKQEFRTRLRAALKRTISRIDVLPVSVSTAVRLAVATISFVGSDKKRQVFLASRAAWQSVNGSRPATWACGIAIYYEDEGDGFQSMEADALNELLQGTIEEWYEEIKDKPGWNELPLKFPVKF